MTVATHNHADAPTEVIEDLARSVGVLVSADPISPLTGRPLTSRRPVELDETGGLDVLRAVLHGKTSANPIIEPVEPATHEEPAPSPVARLRRLGRRLTSWAASVIQTVRDAASWVVNGPAIADALAARRAVQPYAARHAVASTWYGRERSTAERTAVLHRTARQPRDPEGDLPGPPLYWVGYVARMIEVIREQDEVFHPTNGHRFVCS